MGKQTLKSKIQNLIYTIVLPIYLWSIGFETLEKYVEALKEE